MPIDWADLKPALARERFNIRTVRAGAFRETPSRPVAQLPGIETAAKITRVRMLIIGGTLFLGRRLVEAAQARGHQVRLSHVAGITPASIRTSRR
jgi:hypothetical protein